MKRKRFAIYSACIGGYDSVLQPETVDDRFDYFLFTDVVTENKVGIWQVRQVEYTNPDKTRIARYVKTHPEELLPEYEATLWMDANIQIVSSKVYDRFLELFENNVDVASIFHPLRDCIYDEAFEVSYSKLCGRLEHDYVAVKWCHNLWKDHYPQRHGLYETNILFRRDNNVVRQVNALWWDCINKYSKRDQLSCNYALWKLNVKSVSFLSIGESARNSGNVKYITHQNVCQRKIVQANWLEHFRYKVVNLSATTQRTARSLWHHIIRMPAPCFFLTVYGLLFDLVCSPLLIYTILCHRLRKL